jgi:predicted DCC family thiol-disulfide oxidoreductase YuxK
MPPIIAAKPQASISVNQAPLGFWLRLWVLAGMIFSISLGGLEAYWRSQGSLPSVADSKDLWCFWRQRVYRDDGRVVVLLGTSRMMADVSPQALRRLLPDYSVVQLAVRGPNGPIGTLVDLARDPRFKGVIVCSFLEPFIDSHRWGDQSAYYTHHAALTRLIECVASAGIDALLVARTPAASIRRFVFRDPQRRAVGEVRSVASFDRSVAMDFSHALDNRLLKWNVYGSHRALFDSSPMQRPEDFCRDTDAICRCVYQLQRRGGRAAFVYLPICGPIRDRQQSALSINYWNEFKRRAGCACVHFDELGSKWAATCPDGLHLDYRDGEAFATALVERLVHKNVFPNTVSLVAKYVRRKN